MTIRALVQTEFDRSKPFEAAKRFTYLGTPYTDGQPFDSSVATTRRLRQMFECGMLRLGTGGSKKLTGSSEPNRTQEEIVYGRKATPPTDRRRTRFVKVKRAPKRKG